MRYSEILYDKGDEVEKREAQRNISSYYIPP